MCLKFDKRLLVSLPADLTESHGTWRVAVGLLDASSGWGGLASGLGGELLAWGFASGRFAGGLLGTGHFLLKGPHLHD